MNRGFKFQNITHSKTREKNQNVSNNNYNGLTTALATLIHAIYNAVLSTPYNS